MQSTTNTTKPQPQTRTNPTPPAQPMKPVEVVVPVIPASQNKSVDVVDSPIIKKQTHFYYKLVDVDETKRYAMTVSHFESLQSFYAQIVEWFLVFDELYDEFQAHCEASRSHLTKEGLGELLNSNIFLVQRLQIKLLFSKA